MKFIKVYIAKPQKLFNIDLSCVIIWINAEQYLICVYYFTGNSFCEHISNINSIQFNSIQFIHSNYEMVHEVNQYNYTVQKSELYFISE